jgi:hypothetical protein
MIMKMIQMKIRKKMIRNLRIYLVKKVIKIIEKDTRNKMMMRMKMMNLKD